MSAYDRESALMMLALHGLTAAAVGGGLLWHAWARRRHFAALDARLPEPLRSRRPWGWTVLAAAVVAGKGRGRGRG